MQNNKYNTENRWRHDILRENSNCEKTRRGGGKFTITHDLQELQVYISVSLMWTDKKTKVLVEGGESLFSLREEDLFVLNCRPWGGGVVCEICVAIQSSCVNLL